MAYEELSKKLDHLQDEVQELRYGIMGDPSNPLKPSLSSSVQRLIEKHEDDKKKYEVTRNIAITSAVAWFINLGLNLFKTNVGS